MNDRFTKVQQPQQHQGLATCHGTDDYKNADGKPKQASDNQLHEHIYVPLPTEQLEGLREHVELLYQSFTDCFDIPIELNHHALKELYSLGIGHIRSTGVKRRLWIVFHHQLYSFRV